MNDATTTVARPVFWGRDDAGRWHVLRRGSPLGPVTRCGRFLPDDAPVTENPPDDECTACTRERATSRLAAAELAAMRNVLAERRPA